MKFLSLNTEFAWRSPNLVYRDEAVVNVTGGIFHALGHHWSGELLELEREVKLLAIPIHRRATISSPKQKDFLQEVEHWGRCGPVSLFRAGNRLLNVFPVAIGD